MNQEKIKAIEDLEKILKPLDACESQCKLDLNPEKIRKVIALLRTEQLPASEFTKKVRYTWPTYTFAMSQEKVDLQSDQLKEALTIIDRSEAEIKKYVEMDKYKSKQIILGTENYNRICKTVEQLAVTIKELEGIINRAIDGIETLSVLDSWPEGQMKKDVMAIKETLENVENTPKTNPQTDNPRE